MVKRVIVDRIVWGILIFSVIFLVILLPSAVNNSSGSSEITGKAIDEIDAASEPIAKGEIGCSDSDNGLVYSMKGRINYCDSNGCSSETDSCSEKTLKEWRCKNNEKNYEEYKCEYDCDNGACVNLITANKFVRGASGGGGGGGSSG